MYSLTIATFAIILAAANAGVIGLHGLVGSGLEGQYVPSGLERLYDDGSYRPEHVLAGGVVGVGIGAHGGVLAVPRGSGLEGQVGLVGSGIEGQVGLIGSGLEGQVGLVGSGLEGQVGLVGSGLEGQVGLIGSGLEGQVGLVGSGIEGQYVPSGLERLSDDGSYRGEHHLAGHNLILH